TWSAGPVQGAGALLADLVDLRDLGLRTPLPLPVKTAEAYARRGRGAAIGEWHSGWGYPKEDADAEHVLCWGRGAPFDVLFGWSSPLLPGTSFVDLVARVWGPLKETEA
ncbi:MAG: exodeoxyribonuclease gamma subunit, partial [Frankiales bacterium]|nr:exodeoxyribonuclease gamma subunit [Frankiales bacterium]